MILNRTVIQLALISIGILLILSTYFFYPKISGKKKNQLLGKRTRLERVKKEFAALRHQLMQLRKQVPSNIKNFIIKFIKLFN